MQRHYIFVGEKAHVYSQLSIDARVMFLEMPHYSKSRYLNIVFQGSCDSTCMDFVAMYPDGV